MSIPIREIFVQDYKIGKPLYTHECQEPRVHGQIGVEIYRETQSYALLFFDKV
jgi:hypothetical protein